MSANDSDIVKLWEEMGSTTGSMIGRFIGLSARTTIDLFNNNLVSPAKTMGGGNENQPGLRGETWGQMGEQMGKTMGEFIGSGMDYMAKSFENTAVKPMENMEKNQTGQNEKTS